MKVKKSEVIQILLTIASYDAKTLTPISGVLFEKISLGTKRKFQKIQKELEGHRQQIEHDAKDIEKECGEDEERKKKEIEELAAEEVELTSEPVSISFIENIETDKNYDWSLLEKICI